MFRWGNSVLLFVRHQAALLWQADNVRHTLVITTRIHRVDKNHPRDRLCSESNCRRTETRDNRGNVIPSVGAECGVARNSKEPSRLRGVHRPRRMGASGISRRVAFGVSRGVPRLTTSAVASVDSIGPRADAYSQIGSSNCAGKRSRSRRYPGSCRSQRGQQP
jgi:hypothetical protein